MPKERLFNLLNFTKKTNTEVHKFDVMSIVKNLTSVSSLNVFPNISNSPDNARVKIVFYSNCSFLCFVHSGGVINLSLTFKMEYGIGQ